MCTGAKSCNLVFWMAYFLLGGCCYKLDIYGLLVSNTVIKHLSFIRHLITKFHPYNHERRMKIHVQIHVDSSSSCELTIIQPIYQPPTEKHVYRFYPNLFCSSTPKNSLSFIIIHGKQSSIIIGLGED